MLRSVSSEKLRNLQRNFRQTIDWLWEAYLGSKGSSLKGLVIDKNRFLVMLITSVGIHMACDDQLNSEDTNGTPIHLHIPYRIKSFRRRLFNDGALIKKGPPTPSLTTS